jgi:hypothetical protein
MKNENINNNQKNNNEEKKEKDKDFFSINEVINQAFGKDKLETKQKELEAVEWYNSIKIEKLINVSKAVDFNRGNLIVNAKDSSAIQYIQLKSSKIIDAINKKMGYNLIRKISFRIGDYKRYDEAYSNNDNNYNIDIDKIVLNDYEESEIRNSIEIIEDNNDKEIIEIKDKLRKLFESNVKFNKAKKLINE